LAKERGGRMTDRVWVLVSVAAVLAAVLAAEVYLFLRDRHERRGEDWGRRSLTPPVFLGPHSLPQDARSARG
jgi:hypothetical protein